MVAAQASDEVRLSGQSIPPGLDDIVLPGSGQSRLNVRTGFSATETQVVSPLPLLLEIGLPVVVSVESTTGFFVGRQAFIWGYEGWARASIDSVAASVMTIRVTPSEISQSPLRFNSPPAISLDEAVAVYWDSAAKVTRRSTATSTLNPTSPSWSPANELSANITAMTFTYFDTTGASLNPDGLEDRSKVAAIETRITVRSSSPLSNGTRPSFSLAIRSISRNQRIRNAP
jgi:hypothetical protein